MAICCLDPSIRSMLLFGRPLVKTTLFRIISTLVSFSVCDVGANLSRLRVIEGRILFPVIVMIVLRRPDGPGT